MNEAESNPNMPRKCPQCGATLPEGALGELCPACLLKQGAQADTSMQLETKPFEPPTVEEVAKWFPQLEIIAFIGKGGMGAVYKARQPALDRFVALKILPPQAASPGFAERFNREARALARLSHPNIVGVHEFGQVNGQPFFIMEFVDGPNLRQLERAGKLSPREALQIVPQICEALQFAHDEGIVHRDIKPENILVDKKGRIKIADFGIAKILGRAGEAAFDELTETKGAIGTPHYMAPEQVEKPQEVDHRADIFALGVVFYEMLTGELPLGKFAPPSRRVQVDVRLDDVVLRALEKEPDRRYQQASQVKTAVETISSTASGSSYQSTSQAAPAIQEILGRDYSLSISSCVSRGWELVRKDFWPLLGVTALVVLLMGVANAFPTAILNQNISFVGGGLIALLVQGALVGGLFLYFLRKIRREPATVETVFSGFSSERFLHLFVGNLVASVLITLGFICFIVPGIFLWVSWMFTLPLIIDKRLDFWSAMELSRKMVCKHWFKLFGLSLVMLLVLFAGLMVFCVGFIAAWPVVVASLMYAYEDIFGAVGSSAAQAAPAVGPSGTQVVDPPLRPSSGGAWRPLATVGVIAGVLLIGSLIIALANHSSARKRESRQRQREITVARDAEQAAKKPAFGPVLERAIQVRASETDQFLDLDTGNLLTLPPEIRETLTTSKPGEDERRLWQGLDIPEDSARFRYVTWLRENGVDLMFAGDGKVIGFDGIFPMAHGTTSANWEDWTVLKPKQVNEAINVVDWSRRATAAARSGQKIPAGPKSGGIVSSAAQLDSQNAGGPTVNLLTREQSVLWFFQTREGAKGILELEEFTEDPPAAKLRYKLVKTAGETKLAAEDKANFDARIEAASNILGNEERENVFATIIHDGAKAGSSDTVRTALNRIASSERRDSAGEEAVQLLAELGMRQEAMDVCALIISTESRETAFAKLATDAAKAGDAGIASGALNRIGSTSSRDEAAREAVHLLAELGMRKEALEIAKRISGREHRDEALSELAK